MDKIRVMIADDSKYMCGYYELMLNNSQSCVFVCDANNERETLEKVEQFKPDVLLLDVQMDSMTSGLILLPKIKELSPETRTIIISVHENKKIVFEAIRLGAKDYLIKDNSVKDIISKIEAVYYGTNSMNVDVAKMILDEFGEMEEKQKSMIYFVNKLMVLSLKEIQILKALCSGKKYKEIAEENVVEVVTVRTQAKRIMDKLEYTNIKTLIEDINKLNVFELFDDEK